MNDTDPSPENANTALSAANAPEVLREAGKRALEGVAQARRKGGELVAATREKSEAVLDDTREGLAQARRKGGEIVNATREKGEAVIDDAREKSMRAAAETNRLFQEHPIAAVAAAAAAGAVVGIFLPRLNIASRAGKLAGQAIKAAATSETTQRLLAGTRTKADRDTDGEA
jgi:ElaB/YqjD/DUF883 family membrane-anchored ribosome-binding protein